MQLGEQLTQDSPAATKNPLSEHVVQLGVVAAAQSPQLVPQAVQVPSPALYIPVGQEVQALAAVQARQLVPQSVQVPSPASKVASAQVSQEVPSEQA